MIDHEKRIRDHFAESARLKLDASEALAPRHRARRAPLSDCLLADGKILACGNGGSAADAQHFAAELVGRFERERPELPKATPVVGQLNVRSETAGAAVTVDGVRRGTAPMIVTDLTPGDHVVELDGNTGLVKQNVTIESGVQAALVVPMGRCRGRASIGMTARRDFPSRAADLVRPSASSGRVSASESCCPWDAMMSSSSTRRSGFRVRSVQIVAGRSSSVKVDMPNGTIALNAVPWADVWLDGERIGETPIGNYAVPIGVHDLVLRHPELGEQHHKLTVSLKGVTRLSADLRK